MTLRIVPAPTSYTVTVEVVGEKELELAYNDDYEKGGQNEKWAARLGGMTKEQYDFVRFSSGYWKIWLVTWKTAPKSNPFPASVHIPYQGVYVTLTNIRRTAECIAFIKTESLKFDGAASYFDGLNRQEKTLGCYFLPERAFDEWTEHRVLICLFDPDLKTILSDACVALAGRALRSIRNSF